VSDQTTNTNDWQPCPSGQITGMVQRLQAERPSSTIRRMAVPATAVLLLVIAGVYFSQSRPGGMLFKPGGLTCDEIRQHLPAYAKGQVSAELSKQLDEHLADCPECRKMHEKMGGRVAAPRLLARVTSGGDPGRLALAAR